MLFVVAEALAEAIASKAYQVLSDAVSRPPLVPSAQPTFSDRICELYTTRMANRWWTRRGPSPLKMLQASLPMSLAASDSKITCVRTSHFPQTS